MARRSDPDPDISGIDYSDPVNYELNRFYVWSESTDAYVSSELAANWDLLDGIIGRADAATVWPPTFGPGGGIWKEINDISTSLQFSTPLGVVTPWFYPGTIDSTVRAYLSDRGYEFCDGSIVLAADHDLAPLGYTGDFYTPNLHNQFVIGASDTTSAGTAGTTTTAPGMVSTSITGNTGGAGSHTVAGHTHSIGAHYHSVPAHSHTIPNHSHSVPDHSHSIAGGGWTTGTTYSTGGEQTRDGNGTLHRSAHAAHEHRIPTGTGGTQPGPLGYVAGQKFDTTASGAGNTGTAAADVTGNSTAFASGASSTHDNRPQHVGLVYIIKVRNP